MLVISSLGSSPRPTGGTGAPTRGSSVAAVCDAYAIAAPCPRTPPRLASALATPQSQRELLRRGGDSDFLGRLMREHAAGWARLTTPEAIAERAARSLSGATDATIQLARGEDSAGLERRIRIAAVAAGVVGARLERLVLGVSRGIAAVVVDATLRGPVARALARALTLRNAELERTGGDDPRREMRDNDVLIHTLAQPGAARLRDRSDIYSIDADLTRASIASDLIGLPAELFPFDGLSSSLGASFAVDAVRAELASVRPLDDEIRLSLQRAARAARLAAPDILEILEAPWP